MIPKRIFYCWLTKDESSPGLPTQFNVAINQWESICKPEEGWEYILVDWDYMKSNYENKVISRMRSINTNSSPAQLADYCRLVVTISKGGFYLDLDSIISPKFLDLVNSDKPIISARPAIDMQFMCHQGSGYIPESKSEGESVYKDYGKMIVGNYTFFSTSTNHNYLRHKINKSLLRRLGGVKFDIVFISDFMDLGKHAVSMKYFYFNQPIFHFDFGSHNGDKSGFESEFNDWKCKFLDYYNDNHD